jgi:hypothetical protein
MVQGNFSVRLPEDLQAAVDGAVARGAKRNAIVVSALRAHFQLSDSSGQLRAGSTKPHVNEHGMQIGAPRPAAGALLKSAPKKPDRWAIKK